MVAPLMSQEHIMPIVHLVTPFEAAVKSALGTGYGMCRLAMTLEMLAACIPTIALGTLVHRIEGSNGV